MDQDRITGAAKKLGVKIQVTVGDMIGGQLPPRADHPRP